MNKVLHLDDWIFLPKNLVDSLEGRVLEGEVSFHFLENNLVMPLTREEQWAKLRLEAERPLRRLTEEQIKEWMPHRRI